MPPAPRISLEQWRALQAVVDAGGYAQAAARLHKSQSAITYAVQRIEALLEVKPGTSGRLGAVGFCFGGGVANALAVRLPELSAAVAFYGTPPAAADVPKIKAAILAHQAALDTRLASTWPAYDAELTAAHVTHAGYIYAGANHGFHNDTTPRYDEAAAKLAWQRTLDWFNTYLRG